MPLSRIEAHFIPSYLGIEGWLVLQPTRLPGVDSGTRTLQALVASQVFLESFPASVLYPSCIQMLATNPIAQAIPCLNEFGPRYSSMGNTLSSAPVSCSNNRSFPHRGRRKDVPFLRISFGFVNLGARWSSFDSVKWLGSILLLGLLAVQV